MGISRPRSVLLRCLAAALDAPGGPKPGEHVLVAVSGGPDSTALLTGLAELAPGRAIRVTAAHLDHGLRGAEGAAEAAGVRELAERLGVGFVTRPLAIGRGAGLEARARAARYRALTVLADELGATRIATGHTQDDQVETLLLRLLRGTGRRGLGAMRSARGRIFRPLLAATRADVRRFLEERGLGFAVDRTNADLAHARNRVRRLLVPFLTAEFNPRLGSALAALAARLRDEDDFLTAAAAARTSALLDGALLRTAVAAEPPALARRLIRGWLERGTRRSISAVHVERVLELAGGRAGGSTAVPGSARVVREGDRLVQRPGRRAVAPRLLAAILPGATVADPDGRWRLTLSAPRPRRPDDPSGADRCHALFDSEALPGALAVRSVAPGDRIRVAGVGTRKIQDVLVDAKVPREARASVPVLVGAGTALWVAGVLRSAEARIGPATRSVVEGRFERAK